MYTAAPTPLSRGIREPCGRNLKAKQSRRGRKSAPQPHRTNTEQRRTTQRNAEQRGATPSNAVPLRRRGAAAGRRVWPETADGQRCDSAV